MNKIKLKDNDYSNYPQKLLATYCHNNDLENAILRNKILLLTGCPDFGKCDGMDGCCVECSEEYSELWERCHAFRWIFKDFMSED